MKRRIFWSLFSMSVCVLLLCCGVFISIYYNGVSSQVNSRIRSEAFRYAKVLDERGQHENTAAFLSAVAASDEDRVTLIAADGTVLHDNRVSAETMDNHAGRPEVKDALAFGSGEAVRQSNTFDNEIYYVAVRTQSGDVIRIAKETASVWGILDDTAHWIVLAVAAVLAISLLVSRALTRMLVRPFLTLDLEHPLHNNIYDELSPLLKRMEEQNSKITLQMIELSAKKRELEIITGNMKEGLVILNLEGRVILANKSAQRIFRAGETGAYLQFCRDPAFVDAVEKALAGSASTAALELGDRSYMMYANPAVPGSERNAAVLFVVDVTDRVRAETLRREFSANVSHELKTPLSSISAYAELIQNGIAKKEDVAEFALQIQTESARLRALIDDIIRISQLDEGGLEESFTPVNLAETCQKAVETLSGKAAEKEIGLICSCEDAIVNGISAVLYEMVFNLLDNAITYNTPGGKAGIILEKDGETAVLTVWDTGIGIPPEHRERVFERFYRVDKSRSKETGGTGLGLSIVKHGVMLHDATMQLESHGCKGTEIRIKFRLP